jgi:hypothetical protein
MSPGILVLGMMTLGMTMVCTMTLRIMSHDIMPANECLSCHFMQCHSHFHEHFCKQKFDYVIILSIMTISIMMLGMKSLRLMSLRFMSLSLMPMTLHATNEFLCCHFMQCHSHFTEYFCSKNLIIL